MSPEERVCQACALCCDGTLFTRVPLAPADEVPAEVHAVTTATGARYLPQPCAALRGTCCAVYQRRPLVCRRFECLLLVGLRDGEVSEVGALELVQKARALEAEGEGERLDAHLRLYFGRR
ncbi:MAG: YkgJ family cysteine cluster protein [Myxococcales bacterium]|nr:YkgJ family cysteine cluster protein [Myxococcales bacterium]